MSADGRIDVIVVGTGASGGTFAHTVAGAGRRVLPLERGDFLPRETENWEPEANFLDGRHSRVGEHLNERFS